MLCVMRKGDFDEEQWEDRNDWTNRLREVRQGHL